MPHDLDVRIQRLIENEIDHILKIGIGRGNTAITAGLLKGNNVPLLVGQRGFEAGFLVGLSGSRVFAVAIGFLAVLGVLPVRIKGAAADLCIANDEILDPRRFHKSLQVGDGIDTEAVAEGKDLDRARGGYRLGLGTTAGRAFAGDRSLGKRQGIRAGDLLPFIVGTKLGFGGHVLLDSDHKAVNVQISGVTR